MDVKSTINLTREQAEYNYISLKEEAWRKGLEKSVGYMSDTELENELERLNDLVHNGEGFENYMIVNEVEDEAVP